MLGSKFMDMVMGIDTHIELVPAPPAPLPVPTPLPVPFIGMIFDPVQLVMVALHNCPTASMVLSIALDPIGTLVGMAVDKLFGVEAGGPVLINYMPATTTASVVTTKYGSPHVVTPPGVVFQKCMTPVTIGEGKWHLGSSGVWFQGRRAVRTLVDPVWTCSEPSYLPSSVTLPVPLGMPVIIGGFPMPDLMGMLTDAIKAAATAKIKSIVGPPLAKAIRGQGDPPSRLRNLLGEVACHWTGHPVDVASGRMVTTAVDWKLPGLLPIECKRQYSSAVSDRDGTLGYGWNHTLDQAIWLERGRVVYRGGDGREIVFDTFDFRDRFMRAGDEVYEPCNRLKLRCHTDRWTIENSDGITHEFQLIRGDSAPQRRWRLTLIRDRVGRAISLNYSEAGHLEWLRDSGGRFVQFEHDRNGRLVRVALPHPGQAGFITHTRYEYSDAGNLVAVTDALGNVTRYDYSGHLMVQETNRNGLSFYFGYDGIDQNAYCVRTWGDGGIYDHKLVYDKEGRTTFVENSLGHTTIYKLSESYAVIEKTDPHGAKTQYEYDLALRKTKETGPDGLATEWQYDERGNCTRIINPDGSERSYEFNSLDKNVGLVTETGGEWRWQYDGHARMVLQTDPEGRVTEVRHRDDVVESIRFPNGGEVRLNYDAHKNVTSIVERNGATGFRSFDNLGRVTQAMNPNGAVTFFRWNALGDLVEIQSALGPVARYRYDAERNPVEFQNDTHHVRREYGGYNRVVAREEGGSTVRFELNTEDEPIAIVNEQGERYTFELDACGRVRSETRFDGTTRAYQYDKAGRLQSTIHPGGSVTSYGYDKGGRLSEVKNDDGTFFKFEYGAAGLLEKSENESGTLELERDLYGRIIAERANGHEVRSRYGADGGRNELTTSLGTRLRMEYDVCGRIAGVQIGEDGGFTPFARFERDLLGLESAKRFANGIDVEWARDVEGRVQRRETFRRQPGSDMLVGANGPRGELNATAYQWHGDDQVSAILDAARGPRFFDYDARGRMVREHGTGGRVERAMDAAGNVHRTPNYEFSVGGRLEQADGTRFEHDLLGNVVEKLEPNGDRWRYRWNLAGRMTEVQCPDGGRVEFTYDPFARRSAKRVFSADGNLERETKYVWDRNVVVHEQDSELGLINWHWVPDSFTPLAKESGGRRWSIVSDHVGTPTEMYDELGRLAWRMQLDAFGVPSVDVGEVQDCPWRFPGQYEDRETGLFYNRYRYYDPETGRYRSPDPVGLAGGLNAYRYAPDPVKWIDPLGLSCVDADEEEYPAGLSNEDMQAAIDLIHEATFGPEGFSAPQTLTVTPDGRIILSQVRNKPSADAIAAAQALLGPNVEIVSGTTSTNAPGPTGQHAEQRGGRDVPPGSRQASSHFACPGCADFQDQHGIENVTGRASDNGGKVTRFPLK